MDAPALSTAPTPRPLAGKVALVTGGGRGIGRGIALALAQAGCDITVNYLRRRGEAEETVAAAEALGARARVAKANIGDEASARRLVAETIDAFGTLDILVANAASGVVRPAVEIDAKAWNWTLEINARSLLTLAQEAVPGMRARGWGRIVSVSSMGARRTYTNYGAIGASKGALEALTRYLAVEFAPHGIICNCVSPGLVITGALDHFDTRDEMVEHAQRVTPAGRLATPEDVGALVLWLCTDAAAMVVGQTIEVDGGYSLIMGR